jgi:hypothetical protein
MNMREGMRRLGILLGVLGGMIGALAAYSTARELWSASQAHKRFESLMASRTMQELASAAKDQWRTRNAPEPPIPPSPPGFKPETHWGSLMATPAQVLQDPMFQGLPLEERRKVLLRVDPSFGELARDQQDKVLSWKPDKKLGPPPDTLPPDFFDKPVRYLVAVNAGGIRDATVDQTGTVTSIRLVTGESVQRIPPASWRAWFSLLIYPLLGFLMPWGAIRALTWVGAGFFGEHPSMPRN